MVKMGFIVEGETEKIIIDSVEFRDWCKRICIEVIEPVVDAGGSGNLLPRNIENYVKQIRRSSPDKIVVLTDLEDENSVDDVKSRILPNNNTQGIDVVFVAVKAIEAWFLADTQAMRKWLNNDSFYEESPEQTPEMPWSRLKEIASESGARGTGPSKTIFAKQMTKHHHFTVENAAVHPNCPSAKEFHDTLVQMGSL